MTPCFSKHSPDRKIYILAAAKTAWWWRSSFSPHPSVFRSPRFEWLDMIGYNVHSIEIGRMGNWSKLNREREGAWTLNTEQRNKVGILHKYRSGRVWAQCTAYKLFILNFCERKIFFFLFFVTISCWVSCAVISISALIALEGLSIVWVCFTKSGLILSDEDVYRPNTACIMAKLYLLKIISFPKRK